MARLWPVLAALAILIALALFLRGRNPVPPPPPIPKAAEATGAADPVEHPPSPKVPAPTPGPTQDAVPVQKGKLRVTVETTGGYFSGVVGLVRRDGRAVDQLPVGDENRASVVFATLEPGEYRVVFIPSQSQAPASGEAIVTAGNESSLVLTLRAASVLHGTAVDALMRPLAKVRLSVQVPSAMPALEGGYRVLFGGGGARASSAPGGTRSGSWSFSALSTGSLQLTATTGPDGTFAIGGLPPSAVSVEVSFEKARFSQSCLVDSEARIIVPVQPVADAPDPELQEFRRAADQLLTRMIQHPETEDAYWIQLKALIEAWIARPAFPAPDRQAIQESIRKTEDLRAGLKK